MQKEYTITRKIECRHLRGGIMLVSEFDWPYEMIGEFLLADIQKPKETCKIFFSAVKTIEGKSPYQKQFKEMHIV
jgi:hypothetical protein